jgi:hypothetical protein
MKQSLGRKMRALYFEKTGSLSGLTLGNLLWPEFKSGEALVEIHATDLNLK